MLGDPGRPLHMKLEAAEKLSGFRTDKRMANEVWI